MQEDLLRALSIEEEIKEIESYSETDKQLLKALMREINDSLGTEIRYLFEIDRFYIHGSGKHILNYIDSFTSETIRAYLMGQMVYDRIPGCGEILLRLYQHFKQSDVYISKKGKPAPVHIAVRYDNAFRRLKLKRMKKGLLSFAANPRDAFYLPFTVRMLASWRMPEMEGILLQYLDSSGITPESVGLPTQNEGYYPSLPSIRRELLFTAIGSLKYYPSEENQQRIKCCIVDSDVDIRSAVEETLRYMEKHPQ